MTSSLPCALAARSSRARAISTPTWLPSDAGAHTDSDCAHCAVEQDRGETQHEALTAFGAPLNHRSVSALAKRAAPPHPGRAQPSINSLFERDPSHRLQDGVEPKRHHRRESSSRASQAAPTARRSRAK